MKCFTHNSRKISRVSDEIVVFHTGSCNTHCVDFLKGVGAYQMLWHLTGNYDDGCRVHVGVGNACDRIRSAGTRSNQNDAHLSVARA